MKHAIKTTAVSLIALAAAAPAVSAQSFGGPPAYGELVYRSGQAPVSANVRAGGAISADRLNGDCWGYINESPSLVLDLRAGGPVFIAGATDEDTTLIVRGPEGSVTCDDDGAGYPHPGVSFEDAAPGRYEIWFATYNAGVGYPAGAIHVSSTEFVTENPFTQAPNRALPAETTLRLNAGFNNDPRRIDVSAGGEADLGLLDGACYGYADEAPDAEIDYRAGDFDLFFLLETEGDSTIAVRSPSGGISCNDDQQGLNAGVMIEDPESGRYLVWAGELGPRGQREAGVLTVSEIGFGGVDNRLDVTAPALFGSGRLDSGFLPDPFEVAVDAGGPLDADQGLGDTVVAEGYCSGYVTRAPSYELTYEAGGFPLYISAESDRDTTLVVNAPDGAWYCNDDFEGLDPGLEFAEPQSGVYDIYVGTFGSGGTDPATLRISELSAGSGESDGDSGWDDGSIDMPLDLTASATAGDYSLQAGFLPDPFQIDVLAGGPVDADQNGAGDDDMYCAGMVTAAPTVELTWTGEGGPLSLFVESEVDTTLVVNMPDGSWMCDDDGGVGFDAALEFESAPSGIYDIYVGRFSGTDTAPAVLNVSEFEAPQDSWNE
jgi:hypothetical protein